MLCFEVFCSFPKVAAPHVALRLKMTASLDMPMATFLTHVKPAKEEEFINDIVVHLMASAVTVPLDLKGFDPHAGMLGLDVKGGHKSFVSKAVYLVVELARPGCLAPTSQPRGASQASFDNFGGGQENQQRMDEALQKALANALVPNAAPAIHVEVRPLLKESCHLHGLDHRLIPDAAATDQLAMKHAAALKKGIVKPFTFVKLDSFLPSWCPMGDNSLGKSLRMLGFVMHVHISCFLCKCWMVKTSQPRSRMAHTRSMENCLCCSGVQLSTVALLLGL